MEKSYNEQYLDRAKGELNLATIGARTRLTELTNISDEQYRKVIIEYAGLLSDLEGSATFYAEHVAKEKAEAEKEAEGGEN